MKVFVPTPPWPQVGTSALWKKLLRLLVLLLSAQTCYLHSRPLDGVGPLEAVVTFPTVGSAVNTFASPTKRSSRTASQNPDQKTASKYPKGRKH